MIKSLFVLPMLTLFSTFVFRKKLLITLINLELVVLTLFFIMILTLNELGQPISLSFFMLIMSVCEASLGLSLLVSMTRLKGSDMLSLISTFKY